MRICSGITWFAVTGARAAGPVVAAPPDGGVDGVVVCPYAAGVAAAKSTAKAAVIVVLDTSFPPWSVRFASTLNK